MMIELTQNQQDIWRDRYALRDDKNQVVEKSIEETWSRVADAIADTNEEYEEFLGILQDFKFVPGGRILSGAGAQSQKTFYNCYVIPVETRARRAFNSFGYYHQGEDHGSDSREAIFDTINTMVGIMSRGGGVGINWSVLRPADSHLVRVSGTSSGPVGWMHVASTAVGEVEQGGSRRGAAMFMLDIWHPDVLRFIDAKRDNGKITNANVSVGITDKFMEALSRDEDWTFEFPDTTHPAYDTGWDGDIERWRSSGFPVETFGSKPAREIWRAISEAAHASGEPGVIFLDRYNELSTANGEERIICVNPCGEQGLGAYSVCNLGAMNLYAYIKDNHYIGKLFDFERFAADVKTAIRFLDNVIDKTPDYLPETTGRQRRLRRIGLGVMGLADALVTLGLRYGSPDSIKFVEDVFRTMKDAAIESSSTLAKERGPAEAWANWMLDRPYIREYVERTDRYDDLFYSGLRNIFLLTQAPTGTTSLLADVNSGIEPYFNKQEVHRQDRTGQRTLTARAIRDLSLDVLPFPDYIVDSREVTVDEHIAIQAAVQKYVDSSVSKTVNAPADQTVEETARVFTRAYYAGLKGIAYYRDGSRSQQVLYHRDPNERIRELEAEVAHLRALTMPIKPHFEHPVLGTMPLRGRSESPVYRDNIQIFGAQGDTDVDRVRATGTRDWSAPVMDVGPDIWEYVNGCPSCGEKVVHEEGCMKCYGCGWSAC